MPPRRKKTRRRRTRNFSVLGAVESYAYTSILTQGLFNNSPLNFLTGQDNLNPSSTWQFDSVSSAAMSNPTTFGAAIGADKITLRELLDDPGFVAATVVGRAQANMIPMAISAATVSIGMRLFKRVLRRPLSNIQRNLVKPALGAGVRLA
jgi:hypothetical protein